MILGYETAKSAYGSAYRLGKAVADGKIYRIEEGVYSDLPNPSELAIVSYKYPKAVVTMLSAFFYHNLTDEIPDLIDLATDNSASVLLDPRIRQHYAPAGFLETGVVVMEQNGVKFRIYDLERTLIELLRNKANIPYDLYKEVIASYRNRTYSLDYQKFDEYLEGFPKARLIKRRLEEEVL